MSNSSPQDKSLKDKAAKDKVKISRPTVGGFTTDKHFTDELIAAVKDKLQQAADPDKAKQDEISRYSKEAFNSYGVKTPMVRDISQQFWKKIKRLPPSEIYRLCEVLLDSEMAEEQTIAFDWAYRLRRHYTQDDFARFYHWLETYVDTWFKCDDFCSHALGFLLYKIPKLSNFVLNWTESSNRWVRRAAAVALLPSLRKKEQLDLALKVADKLLTDEDDLVQKGYGWMLKEASKKWPQAVFKFVLERKQKMPRTALRYAIEKLSSQQRDQAMS